MSDGVILNPAALHELLESEHGPVAADLERRAIVVESRAKRLLSQQGTGRIYRRRRADGKGYIDHQASAPGEPPTVDHGRLRSTITHRMGIDAVGLFAEVGSPVEYAEVLELGSTALNANGQPRIAARPYLRPALYGGDA